MTLSELCVSAASHGGKRATSAPPLPPVHTQELYDVRDVPAPPMERCASNTSTFSYSQDICRICHCEGDADLPLIAPCFCAGSLRYVHQSCLQQWIKSSDTKSCELCKFNFIMHSKIKPFNKWERLDMSGMERRKIACSVTFHLVAITCVVWSLYVLIERTTQEVQQGALEWPFWTKLIVVAIGFTGGLVFMYVQCKMYLQLCKRWRAFNRVIYVQNAPEKVPLSERERAEVRRDGRGQAKDNCSESDKSLMGVSIITGGGGTAHHHHHHDSSTTPTTTTTTTTLTTTATTLTITSTSANATVTTTCPPGAVWTDSDIAYSTTNSTTATTTTGASRRSGVSGMVTSECRHTCHAEVPFACHHGAMAELSGPALVTGDMAVRVSSGYGACVDRPAMSAPHHEGDGPSRGVTAGRRDGVRVEARIIHTPNLRLQVRTETDADGQVETLHLDTM